MVEVITAGLVTIIPLLGWSIRESRKSREAVSDGVSEIKRSLISILRFRLTSNYMELTDNNTITSKDSDIWEDLYKSYKNLGGNGHIDHMNKIIHNKEIKD